MRGFPKKEIVESTCQLCKEKKSVVEWDNTHMCPECLQVRMKSFVESYDNEFPLMNH